MSKPHLIVIGNGMAGCRAVEEILARDATRYRITIFGAEPHVNYNRIMLSPLLAGDKSFDDIVINDLAWYADNAIELVASDPVVAIDRKIQTVTARSGRVESYDTLILATGSDPFIIPVPGHDLQGVVTFRDMDDVGAMLRAAESGGDAVVIGGGLLGLEAAHGLSLRGMKVTVLHIMPTLMERQLDEAAGWLLKEALEARGQVILTGADTAEIYGQGKVEGVRLKNGRDIPAALVVMAVGIRPNVKLARDAGLAIGRGIHVDDHLVTSDANILAVGECVEHNGLVYGLVAPLWEMCRSLADGLVATPSGYTLARSLRPSSRSRGSTCSRPATFPVARAARTSSCAMPRAASTSASWSRRPRDRRGAVRRYAGRQLVFRSAQAAGRCRRYPRRADLRPGLRQRRRGRRKP